MDNFLSRIQIIRECTLFVLKGSNHLSKRIFLLPFPSSSGSAPVLSPDPSRFFFRVRDGITQLQSEPKFIDKNHGKRHGKLADSKAVRAIIATRNRKANAYDKRKILSNFSPNGAEEKKPISVVDFPPWITCSVTC